MRRPARYAHLLAAAVAATSQLVMIANPAFATVIEFDGDKARVIAGDLRKTPSAAHRSLATTPYDADIEALAGPLDPALVKAVIAIESGFDPLAISPKGAMGLMQIMPATAKALGLEKPFDPRANIAAGVRYLSAQLRRFRDLKLALAAYNAGPQAVIDARGVPPFPETQNYVEKVLALAERLTADRAATAPVALSATQKPSPMVREW